MTPAVRDYFCAAGGCSDGYAAAGFSVSGVDIDPQKWYPYPFTRADAMRLLADPANDGDAPVRHASPPCHAYSRSRELARSQGRERAQYDDLLQPTVDLLEAWAARTGGVWVVENVPGAPMPPERTVMLCGRAFGLGVRRHRLFASNVPLMSAGCACGRDRPVGVYGRTGDIIPQGGHTARSTAEGLAAMGFPPGRMPWSRLTQAIPPAYTQSIGEQILDYLARAA